MVTLLPMLHLGTLRSSQQTFKELGREQNRPLSPVHFPRLLWGVDGFIPLRSIAPLLFCQPTHLDSIGATSDER
jgi:hypothetical protein